MKTPLYRALALGACLPLPVFAQTAAAPPAAAASAPAETVLPVVKVRAQAIKEDPRGPVDGYAASRSATATRTDTPLNEIPQSISVITAEQIRDQNAQTMQEVLRYTAGVQSAVYGLDNRGDWFALRGGSEGSVLLDGLRRPLMGYWGSLRDEPYAFERVEVLRGPASVVAGQNGPGGVVNMVSKRPQPEVAREVAVQFGNHDHKQAMADLTGPVTADGQLMYRVVGLYKDSGTQVDHAFDDRSFLAASLTWQPSARTRFTVYTEYQKDESGNLNGFFPIEGTLKPAPNGYIPMNTFIGEPDWDTYGGERTRLGYELEQKLSSNWTLHHRLRYDRLDGSALTAYAAWWLGYVNAQGHGGPYDPNPPPIPIPDSEKTYLNREWYAFHDRSQVTNADLYFEGKLQWGSVQHTLLIGGDGFEQRTDQKNWDDLDLSMTPLDVYNPVYGTFAKPVLPDRPFISKRVRQAGVLVQDQMKWNDWIVVGALRHDKAAVTDAPTRNATTKNFGVVYQGANGWSPYASYSESFEPLTPDVDAPTYDPRRGKQVEFGIKWMPMDRVTASAAMYELKETGRLEAGASPNAPQVQIGEVTVNGFELETAANWRGWDWIASYTYTNAHKSYPGADGTQLSGIPKNMAAAWGVYNFGRLGLPGLRAGAGARYVGETTDGVANSTIVPSNTLFDLLVSYETGPWRMALNVENVTDKAYVATCLERGDCWYGARRQATATLAYSW